MRDDFEASAPNLDEIRGGVGCFRNLMRDLEQPELLHDLGTRFGYIGDCANRRIEIGRILRESPAPVRAQLLADAAALTQVAFSGQAADPSSEAYWNREALDDALTNLALIHARDRAEFKLLVAEESSRIQVHDAGRMRRVFRDVANGLGHVGIEQGESMRSARSELTDLVTDTAGDRSGLGWLLLGWLCLWNSAYCADAVGHFSQGLAVVGSARDYLSHLLHRFLGVALEAGGRHGEALEAAKTALGIRPTADLAIEASRYAIQCGRSAESKQLFETAVRQEPMYLFLALADPDMSGLELTVVTEYATAGAHMRQTALRAVEAWQAMITRVHAAESCLGETIELPFELADGLEEMREAALKSDVLEAIGVRSAAKKSASELYQFVLKRISSLVGQRDAEAVAARSRVTESSTRKGSVKHNAEAQAEAIITQTEAELRQLVGSERSCGSLGSAIGGSFVMLMVYVVAAGVMGPRGVDTSFDSPFGMAGMCLIAAPIVLGLGSSAAGGLKQVTLSSEIERRAKYAREKAKATLIEVERNCDRQAEVSKTTAATLDERARTAAEALRVLRQAPQSEGAIPVPQSVSRRAA